MVASELDSDTHGAEMKAAPTSTKLPITQKKGHYYLRKTFEGKQREIALGSDSKNAKTRALRFLATAESSGFDTALAELKGKPVIKRGANPTIAEMEILYRDYCKQSARPPRGNTIAHNIARLKCLMNRAGVKTVGKIDKQTLAGKWFTKDSPTQSEKRTFAAAIGAAASIFKKDALAYYKSRNIPLVNPFEGLRVMKPKVSAYIPLSPEIRESIWNDCQTELAPHDAMIVLMALGIGMRRSEIEAALPSWLSSQGAEKAIVEIREEKHFTPKNGESGMVPIPKALLDTLLKLRGVDKSPFFVPCDSKKAGTSRLWMRVKAVNAWLKSKGVNDPKPLHCLRKELGSIIAKSQGVLEASKILRNTVAVCSTHYVGLVDVATVDMAASFEKPKDPIKAKADSLGISVEALLERLAKMA